MANIILEWLEKLAADTVLVLRFFSRLPIPDWFQVDDGRQPKLNEAIVAFPIAGLIIATPAALLWYATSRFLSPFLAASLAIALGTLITGALHEDGLADCADGLGGSTTRERALEIMRDSTIGTYGASVLFFSFTIRILALAVLSPWSGAMALLMSHSTARASMVIAIHTAHYARQSGLGDAVRDGIDKDRFYTTLGVTLALSFIIALASGQLYGLFAPLIGMFAAWGLLQWLKSRLGGYTGDGLGAMEQVAEITVLIVLAAMWS